jgi:microcystin-dependent protein
MSATQKFFRFVFGQTGDRAAVPDTTPVDGSVGYQQGYGFDYQRAPGDPLVKNLERSKWNQLLYDITLGLRQYQTMGFPEFIQPADNGGFAYAYAKNACVRWTDGQVYLSLVDANTSDPTDATKWQLALLGAGVGGVQFFPASAPPMGYIKANGAVLSRAAYPVLWAYAQASGNLAVSDGAWQSGQFSPGDGVNTFRIPDARGYHPRAWDDGRGIDSGRVLGSVQSDQFPSHAHGVNDPWHAHGTSDPGHWHYYQKGPHTVDDQPGTIPYGNFGGGTPDDPGYLAQTRAVATGVSVNAGPTGISIAAAGTGSETRVKTVAWLACIKYL